MLSGWLSLLLSLMAGLGTFLGGLLVVGFLGVEKSEHYIGPLQALSAGVMLFLTLFDILPEAHDQLSLTTSAFWFFIGILWMIWMDYCIPESWIQPESHLPLSHKDSNIEDEGLDLEKRKKLWKSGWLTFLGMALHNAPEGIAVYFSTVKNQNFGISLAFAMTCHNILEGMAVAIPLYMVSQNKKKTLNWTFLNGLFEPLFVLFCCLIFGFDIETGENSMSLFVAGMLSVVGGVMFYISLWELIPNALSYSIKEKNKIMMYLLGGMIIGFLVLSISQIGHS